LLQVIHIFRTVDGKRQYGDHVLILSPDRLNCSDETYQQYHPIEEIFHYPSPFMKSIQTTLVWFLTRRKAEFNMDLVDLSGLKEGEGERTVCHSAKSLTPISTHNTLHRVEGFFQDIQHRSGGKLGFYRAEISI
jgi:hypothetical protein